jgi:hypothetical protein
MVALRFKKAALSQKKITLSASSTKSGIITPPQRDTTSGATASSLLSDLPHPRLVAI